MDFSQTVNQRYSARAYRPDPIDPGKLYAVLQAARLAPSASNRQPFKFIVIRTEGRREELSRIYDANWFTQAPLLICVCSIPDKAWNRRDGKNYADVDAAIAMDHVMLAATDQGLGTCWVTGFDPNAAREILELPYNVEPLAFSPLGYAADRAAPKSRLDYLELVCFDRWSDVIIDK